MARLWHAVALAVAVLGVLVPVAVAHRGNPNFRSEVRDIAPAVDGVQATVVNYDDSIELRNRSGRTVVVRATAMSPTCASPPTAPCRSTTARRPST